MARSAIALPKRVSKGSDGSRASVRRAHVGYYLVDQGRESLETQIRIPAAPPRPSRSRGSGAGPQHFYFTALAVVTLAILVASAQHGRFYGGNACRFVLLLIPASQAAVDFVNGLLNVLLPPRILPKLDFSSGIPEDCVTMVAVPALCSTKRKCGSWCATSRSGYWPTATQTSISRC